MVLLEKDVHRLGEVGEVVAVFALVVVASGSAE